MQQPGERAPAPGPLLLVQDLANTVDIESADDQLRTPADLDTWARDHGLHGPASGTTDLADVIALREALRDACQAHTGTDVPEATGTELRRLLGAAPLVLSIDPRGGASLRPAEGLTGAAALTAHLAAGITTAVADGTWPRLKACAAHNCRWVYYDRSPAGRSRWCTMAVCGSRAKMRAYRSRTP
ncbi:CGNR zinc finger domain-containing protein [Streptomyces sp. H10-C2]|uniref:CGNR zinc finger domain-containing protein n=1 Tax=unclassified Streptomyces TaxID=2593676 RepID=UPI0024B8E17F|nr:MULTISPECIES: CGNR zinc finger domain-containing protein [unclassified Streptomyces]MDJ0341278.1 CGNR zinc finger domain-containing protein [Streptomyces sp. PH10-H1]MDJ0370873.1 CGNR zinc finger domain-containing protein [Streptomyces sp. H10-C2]